VCAIFFGVLMLAVVFLVPETAYKRDSLVVVPASSEADEKHAHMTLAHEHELEKGSEKATTRHQLHPTVSRSTEKKHTYLQSLRIFTGRYTYAPMWKIFLRPVVLFFYPGVLWGFLLYGRLLVHGHYLIPCLCSH
jgi:hypothetical protein